jgi:peptide/nickel transport system substrate-binding protein
MRPPSSARTRHRRALLGAVLAASLAIAACGGDDDDNAATDGTDAAAAPDDTTGDTSAPAGSTPDGTAPAGDDEAGPLSAPEESYDPNGTIRFGYAIGPSQGLDPHKTSLAQDTVWLAPLYDPLIIELPDASLVPGLATEWEFVDDGMGLQLTLREGVTFHDGEPFNADAVKANIERAKTVEGSAVAPLLAVIDSVEIIDEYTVKLVLNGPAATLPRILSDRPGMMVSPKALEDPDLPQNPVGAGMFRLEEYKPGDRAVMVKFEDYWNPEWQNLARLEIIQQGDPQTRLNGVRTGELDLALLEGPQFLEAEQQGLAVEQYDTTTNFYLQFNRTRAHFDDVRVRQAMNYAIDREGIAQAVFLGLGDASPQFYTDKFPDGYIPELEDRYPYDPEKAKELLAEAGLEDGFSFDLLVPTLPSHEQVGQIAQAQFAEVGITANLISVDPSSTASTFYNDEKGDMVVGTTPGRTDPAMFAQLFFTEANSNPDGHLIPEVTEQYELALVPRPDEERVPILQELMRQTVEQAGNIVLFHPRTLLAGDEGIGGFHWALRGQPDWRGAGIAAQ